MIYKYPKNKKYQNYISSRIEFINIKDYNKIIAKNNINENDILIIEYSKFNLFGINSDNRELKILKIYLENKNNTEIKNLYPRNFNFIKTNMIILVHKLIKSIKNKDIKLYNFLIQFSKEEIEFYFAKYIFNAFEGNEYGPLTLPNIAKINHSCRPNVKFTFNKIDGCMYLKAIKNIKKGEEIIASYLENKNIIDHKNYLREHYNFECECIC